jgi:ATP-dependent DNA helicase UvrD/PcrA
VDVQLNVVEFERILGALNPEQREAVAHVAGPILVLAGAGSGKTRVLTTRIVYLIEEQGVDPATILAVTFTNKAAAEMRDRVRRLLGHEPGGLWVGTFHAIGARLLRRHATRLGWSPNFSIYDADQQVREVKRVMEALELPLKRWHPKGVHGAISTAKNQLVTPEEYAAAAVDAFERVVADVYPRYEVALKEQNAFDFDDLLVRPVQLLAGSEALLDHYRQRFRFVLVDEYQDTNRAQYRLLELLAREHGNLMVVGDDDQSIYGWRGADIRNILDFERDFPGAQTVRLEQNYRSTGRILEVANRVIAENVRRKGKVLRTDADAGDRAILLEAFDERDEASWIVNEIERRRTAGEGAALRSFVVLYRTNAQSRALEEAFRARDVPYQIVGGTRFYERREIMDVLAYLRLIANPADAGALDRILNYPRRGIGNATRSRLFAWGNERGLAPFLAALRATECDTLPSSGAASVTEFAQLVERFRGLAPHMGVEALLERLLQETRILEALAAEGPDGEDRIDNVRELVAGAAEFDSQLQGGDLVDEDETASSPLELFLQKVALITDVDRHDPEADVATLMTVHNAKGLEFHSVFISGLEDGLFPLARAYDDPDQLEEERRLFYVGITRARRSLYLTHARLRRRAGEIGPAVPSSFLAPIPGDLVEKRQTETLSRTRNSGPSRWGEVSGTDRFGSAGDWAESPRGLVIDFSDAQDAPRFVKGERVRHPRFGGGVIRELSGFGRELKAVIDFDGAGRKKIMVQYANLQKEL